MINRQRTVLVLGAASDIGLAIATEYAKAGNNLALAARNAARLEVDAEDLRIRYQVNVQLFEWDVLAPFGDDSLAERLSAIPEIVVCVVGLLGDQIRSENDPSAAELVMRTNYLGPALLLGDLANRMVKAGRGTIIGISSVAGDRGRASNYVYGAAKAGLSAFLSGLRNRLSAQGIHVITVKPGFVRTKMTAGMKLPNALTAAPNEVAQAVVAAERKHKDVIYVRPVWQLIMFFIRSLPEGVFKKMKI